MQPVWVATGESRQAAAKRVSRMAYALQFSRTNVPGRKNPQDFTREAFADLIVERHKDYFIANNTRSQVPNEIQKVIVFSEKHHDNSVHLYAGILCAKPYAIEAIMALLRERDNVYCSFSASHDNFWTIIVYGAVPSIHKAPEEIDQNPYHSTGKTVREELAEIPRSARRYDKERVQTFLGAGVARAPAKRQRAARMDLEACAYLSHHL